MSGVSRSLPIPRAHHTSLSLHFHRRSVTNTDSLILFGFFALCVSQVILLDCDVEALGGVYCYAFLSVMSIFAFGNMILKVKRPSLPRLHKTSWLASIAGFLSVVTALLGNILGKPELLTYFFVYFIVIGVLVLSMFNRVNILRVILFVLREMGVEEEAWEKEPETLGGIAATRSPKWWWNRGAATQVSTSPSAAENPDETIDLETAGLLAKASPKKDQTSKRRSCFKSVVATLSSVRDVPFIFFAKHDDLYVINKAVLYVQKNEQTSKLIIVHCKSEKSGDTQTLSEHVKLIDVLYPKIKVSLLIVEGAFGIGMIEWLAQELAIPINAMFITCPDKDFTMKIQELRGMRIITY